MNTSTYNLISIWYRKIFNLLCFCRKNHSACERSKRNIKCATRQNKLPPAFCLLFFFSEGYNELILNVPKSSKGGQTLRGWGGGGN